MASRIGCCCLCRRDHIQFCKAHIIPLAFVQIVAGKTKAGVSKARDADFFTLQADKATSFRGGAKAFHYDQNIICEDCDNKILGRYDEALVKFCKSWIECSSEPDKIYPGRIDFPLPNIETSKSLFLAVAAILWRAGVSSRFPAIELGKYSEVLREWLYSGCPPPGSERIFSISVEAYPLQNFGIDDLDHLRLGTSPEILRHKDSRGTFYELFLPSLYMVIRVGHGDGRHYNPASLWCTSELKVPIIVKPYAGSRHASITAEIHQRSTGGQRHLEGITKGTHRG
jgi:hypothetical protein